MRGRGDVTPVCGEADRDHGKGGAELSAWRHSPLTISVTIVTPRMCHVSCFGDSSQLIQPEV